MRPQCLMFGTRYWDRTSFFGFSNQRYDHTSSPCIVIIFCTLLYKIDNLHYSMQIATYFQLSRTLQFHNRVPANVLQAWLLLLLHVDFLLMVQQSCLQ